MGKKKKQGRVIGRRRRGVEPGQELVTFREAGRQDIARFIGGFQKAFAEGRAGWFGVPGMADYFPEFPGEEEEEEEEEEEVRDE